MATKKPRKTKKVDKKPKKKVGRKWFDGKDEKKVVAKLEEVWSLGGTNAEASYLANVSEFSISRYLKAHPELKEFRKRLQEKPILKARQTIIKGLEQSDNAKWYLERKKKGEFSPRTETLDEGTREQVEKLRKDLRGLFDGDNTKKR